MVPPPTAIPANEWFCPECLGHDCRSNDSVIIDESIAGSLASVANFEKDTVQSLLLSLPSPCW